LKGVASTRVNVPHGSLPHEPTRLERLAVLAGVDADWLRDYLYDAIADAEEAERVEMQRILAEAIAESEATLPVAETANEPIYHPSTKTG
jgi:hypothetical protein